MSALRQLSSDQQRRLQEAASWRLRLRDDPALELSPRYIEWAADPQNLRALNAVQDGWSAVAELGTSPKILEMRQAALARVRQAGARRWRPRIPMGRVAAALLVTVAVGGGATYVVLGQPVTYRTEIGERRAVMLSDGSRISLDSDTKVRIRYSRTARAVELDRGRTRFDVAHDVARPFAVTAGPRTVVAVGTSFEVEKLGSTVLVTLIQGRVVIKTARGAHLGESSLQKPWVSLSAGQQLVAAQDAQPVVAPANLQTATAWEAGHLIFKDETLGEAVERVNRYTDRPLVVDPAVAGLRISGVFDAGDIGSFVSAVTSYLPVQASTTAGNGIELQGRS